MEMRSRFFLPKKIMPSRRSNAFHRISHINTHHPPVLGSRAKGSDTRTQDFLTLIHNGRHRGEFLLVKVVFALRVAGVVQRPPLLLAVL